jgi:sugar/nucleoside kinase (ribokinase family)
LSYARTVQPEGDDSDRRASTGLGRRRRGAGRRFLVVGDVLDGVIVQTTAVAAGQDDPAASIRYRPDGAAGNVAAWLGFLGADVDVVGRVGIDDVYRHETALRAAGVRPHLRYDGGSPTGAVVSISSGRGTTALSDPAASGRLGVDDVDVALVAGADIALLTGEALLSAGARSFRTLFARIRHGAARTAVDPSSAARVHEIGPAAFLDAVDGVDLLLPAADEARALTGCDDVLEAAARLAERVPLVVVTCGADGAVVARPGRTPQGVAATPVSVVDPNGAGDAFAAGFLCAWATDPVRHGSAAREGARVAARALGVIGARPPV